MRTGLTIVMMLFFTSLALDLAVPAVILLSLLALDKVSAHLKGGLTLEGTPA